MSLFHSVRLYRLKKHVRATLKVIKKIVRKNSSRINPDDLDMVNAEIAELEQFLAGADDLSQLEKRCVLFERKTGKVIQRYKKSVLREYAEAIITAVILALVIRTFIVQAFKIPTGSMQPTLHGANYYGTGDRILVNKFIYGAKSPNKIMFTDIHIPYFQLPKLRLPRRGDIVVFSTEGIALLDEEDQKKDFIKRLVGLPGDRVEIIGLRRELLFARSPFNGKIYRLQNPVKVYTPAGEVVLKGECRETGEILTSGPINPHEGVVLINGKVLDDPEIFRQIPYFNEGQFGARHKSIIIPDHSYFVLGDNSPSSKDSRFWGYVPEENMRGMAFFVYWPLNRIGITR